MSHFQTIGAKIFISTAKAAEMRKTERRGLTFWCDRAHCKGGDEETERRVPNFFVLRPSVHKNVPGLPLKSKIGLCSYSFDNIDMI